ncbi:MAG: argininosuccinate lyase [Bacillota bacterium]|nr:argininosuccinate lyase [Bacillota bacterium]
MKLWGGRFREAESSDMESFNSSLGFDKRLYSEDIEGSMAHVKMLGKCSILSDEEVEKILSGLKSIKNDIESGELIISGDYEDIHSFVELNLIKRIGETAKKLHTARSRNDQVALDFKLFCKKSAKNIIDDIIYLIEVLGKKGEENNLIMPGYTHLQRAQVVTFKHHLNAYVSMFKRDTKRIENAIDLLDESPLGACALSGTTYDIDREYTAEVLGFKKPADNLIDAVSDRDFVIELTSSYSIAMMHLSRLSEEIILWSSKEFDFIILSDLYSTGSSIMPQKKNPDAAELIRGKTGRVYGDLVRILTIMKGLPLAYNKDMQEDKEGYFDAYDTLSSSIKIMAGIIYTLKVNESSIKKAVKQGFLNATSVADYLTKKGMPFRDAHGITGEIVIYAENKGIAIEDMSIEELNNICSDIEKDIFDYIDYEKSIKMGIKKLL